MDSASGDADIDAMLDDTFARVGISPTVAEASRRLQQVLDAARGAPPEIIDPRTLSLRFTRLHAFAQSAAHYLLACQDGRDETIAMRMGSAFHGALFHNREVLCYDGRRQGKAWERFERAADERRAVILNVAEYRVAMGMIRSVREHERAMELLFDGTTTEFHIEWALPNGRKCSSRPDAFHIDTRCVELKSTRCASPRWFIREALKRHYHCQLSFYDDAIEHFASKRPPDDFIVAVENVAPYCVTVVRIPAETRDVAAKINHGWLADCERAEKANYYGSYVESDIELVLDDDRNREPITVEVDGELVTID